MMHPTLGNVSPSKSPEYMCWTAMLRRCGYRGEKHAHPNYAGRVTVCEAWRGSFEQFVRDMGPRPSKDHTIERNDGGGHYEPANCRWATRHEQTRNTTANVHLTHDGQTMLVTDWSAKTGLGVNVITKRIQRGWPVADALTRPAGTHLPGRPHQRGKNYSNRARAAAPVVPSLAQGSSELLTPEQVATEIGVKRRRVYELAQSLPCARLGTGPKAPMRISRADLPTYAQAAKGVQS